MKIMIAIPCMDQVATQFSTSLAMLRKVGDCVIASKQGSLIYAARDDLAKMAIKMDADYVLWLDSDMVFEPDILERLLQDTEKGDIITGLYFRRSAPFSPVLYDQLELKDNKPAFTEFSEIPEDVFEVGGIGFGCVLMPTDVLLGVALKHGDMFSPFCGMGEDIAFSWRARQCGFKIVCDPSIKLGHVGHIIITEDFYKQFKGGAKQ